MTGLNVAYNIHELAVHKPFKILYTSITSPCVLNHLLFLIYMPYYQIGLGISKCDKNIISAFKIFDKYLKSDIIAKFLCLFSQSDNFTLLWLNNSLKQYTGGC